MHSDQWHLQDAKTQLSQVVEAALRGEPQHITRRGKQAVVVLSEESFAALQRNARAAAPGFIAHLLSIPKDGDTEETVEPARLVLREVDFL